VTGDDAGAPAGADAGIGRADPSFGASGSATGWALAEVETEIEARSKTPGTDSEDLAMELTCSAIRPGPPVGSASVG
jgi:hypothetical protein